MSRGPRRAGLAGRYLPVLAVVIVVAAGAGALAVVTGGDGEGDPEGPSTPVGNGVTVFEAGDDPAEFAHCDPETGRVAIPTVYAAPCVEMFAGDNGGATAPGVSAEAITVVAYVGDPALDPLGSALVESTGTDVSVDAIVETTQAFFDLFAEHYELSGREIDLEIFVGTGAPSDEVKAKADAIAIADLDPFAVIGGPVQAPAFQEEITARGILCLGTCATATSGEVLEDRAPLIYPESPTPEQAAAHTAELVAEQLVGRPAAHAGDPELQNRERVFGFLHYDTPDGRYTHSAEALVELLEQEGTDVAVDLSYFLDLSRAQETARATIAQLKDAGVTTVIFAGDPLMPTTFTEEATRQDYFPEWVIGPSILVDRATFARTFDQQQWAHAFGISTSAVTGDADLEEAFQLHQWYACADPASNAATTIVAPIRTFFTGVHLAGPRLTPDTFRAGVFAFPPSGGGPSRPSLSRGEHGIWPATDWAGADDMALVWWDPDAEGEAGNGELGRGLYRFVEGGARFLPGAWPDDPLPLFDPEGTVTRLDRLASEDQAPDYPSPCEE